MGGVLLYSKMSTSAQTKRPTLTKQYVCKKLKDRGKPPLPYLFIYATATYVWAMVINLTPYSLSAYLFSSSHVAATQLAAYLNYYPTPFHSFFSKQTETYYHQPLLPSSKGSWEAWRLASRAAHVGLSCPMLLVSTQLLWCLPHQSLLLSPRYQIEN